MSDHLDRKAWREQEYNRGSDADLRRAERMSDTTDAMHDARQERQADSYQHRESWAENYRARHSEAGQHVAEARTELQAVESERRGQSL